MFDDLMNDTVSLIKTDGSGQRFDNIKASVQSSKIFIDGGNWPIEEGDEIERKLPNGTSEVFVVVDRGYYPETLGFPPHFQMKVKRKLKISLPENRQFLDGIPVETETKNNSQNPNKHITVFISYSHDSPEYRQKVQAVCEQLRSDGIDAYGDFYVASPPEGWPNWMLRKIKEARFVLVFGSKEYVEKLLDVKGQKGKGVKFEGVIITQELYENNGLNEKFIPVFLGIENQVHIPQFLKPYTHYNLEDEQDYKKFYAHITDQFPKPPKIGEIKKTDFGKSQIRNAANNPLNMGNKSFPKPAALKKFSFARQESRNCDACGYPKEIGVHKLPLDEVKHNNKPCSSCGTDTAPACAIGMGHFIYLCENCGDRWSNI